MSRRKRSTNPDPDVQGAIDRLRARAERLDRRGDHDGARLLRASANRLDRDSRKRPTHALSA